jgi:Tfp pilus assembly protein PilF
MSARRWLLFYFASASSVGFALGCGSAPPKTPDAEATAPGAATGGRPGATESPAASGAAAMSPAAATAYSAGVQAFDGGDLEGASQQFSRAVAADARAYPAHMALGTVQERRGETAKALDSYARALEASPDYAPAIAAKVRLLLSLGRAAEADTFARGLQNKYPDSAAVLAALAEIYSARGDSTSAQQFAQKALKKDPDYRPAMVTLARDHYRARRLDLALYTLTAILDGYGQENPPRDKNNADARLLRALILKEQGKRKLAIEEFGNLIKLEAGNAVEARPLLEDALKYDASNVLVHLNLGDAYRLLGKPKDALDHLSWVSRKDATLPQTHYNLGLVYLFSTGIPNVTEEQAIDQAIEAFERFKKLEPRAARGAGDDVDELIARARNKKAILEAMKEQPAAPAEGESGGEG